MDSRLRASRISRRGPLPLSSRSISMAANSLVKRTVCSSAPLLARASELSIESLYQEQHVRQRLVVVEQHYLLIPDPKAVALRNQFVHCCARPDRLAMVMQFGED